MKKYYTGFCDMNTGKILENGHIAIVKYVWNSYVGQIALACGTYQLHSTGAERHYFSSPHTLKNIHTFQIIGHVLKDHPDYNQDVYNWYMSETIDCPIEITVYNNCEV